MIFDYKITLEKHAQKDKKKGYFYTEKPILNPGFKYFWCINHFLYTRKL